MTGLIFRGKLFWGQILEASLDLELDTKWTRSRWQTSVATPSPTNTMVEVVSDDDNRLLVYTENEILKIGLHLVGYKKRWIERAKKKTNLDHSHGQFGSNPNVLAELLGDWQKLIIVILCKLTMLGFCWEHLGLWPGRGENCIGVQFLVIRTLEERAVKLYLTYMFCIVGRN
jgi:hypothetical protein